MASIYSDLDISFTKHPVTKDVSLKVKDMAIIQSIKNLLMTNFGERPFNPKFGCGINAMLFEPLDGLTASMISNEIKTAISNYEPRVSLDTVTVIADYDNDAYNVSLRFYVNNSTKPQIVSFFLNRLR